MIQTNTNLWLGVAVLCAVFLAAVIVCILFRKEKLRVILWLLTAGIGIVLGVMLFFLLTRKPSAPPIVPPASTTIPTETAPATEPPEVPALPTQETAAGTEPTAADATLSGPTWYADCQEFITLRATASTKAEALATIPVSETMTLISWESDFAKVSYQGQEGYVLASYIQPLEGPKAIDLRYNDRVKRATLYAGDGYALYIPVTGWDRSESETSVTWKSTGAAHATLTIATHAGKDLDALRTQLMGEYEAFSLWEDKRGNLAGEDAEGQTMLTISLYPLPDGVLTVTARYPVSAMETLGYELSAITDSVMVSAE